MQRFFLFLVASALLAVGCASTSPKLPPNYVTSLKTKGVSDATVTRIQNGRKLRYNDILNLVQHGVPTGQIISYLKATMAPYTFNTAQLQRLQQAGASQDLIGYLKGSAALYSNNPYLGHPYYTDPAFMGEPPFGWDGFGDPMFGPGFY